MKTHQEYSHHFDFEFRAGSIARSKHEIFDLLIIGGGINGAGIAREAALRGMKVALIEQNDFASGTSSRSSKLIHGGIRYLENFEFHLVFEALSERAKLFEIAPHLVHPLRFLLPLYEGGRVGMAKMGLGMWAYDALSLFEAPELHERLTPDEAVARAPQLSTKKLLGAFEYSDAYMDDDRLVYETLRSASRANSSAAIMSYVRAQRLARADAGHEMFELEVQDQLNQEQWTISARHIVSTVGAWTDELGEQFDQNWKKKMRPTKGVHLTFRRDRIPLESAVVMAAEERIVFAIPRHDMVIIGTTDTDFSGHPQDVTVKPDDVQYLLRVADHYFPHANLKSGDIIGAYAGVRPLVKDDSATEGKTSREHEIWKDEKGITFVAGGKYTTYRLIAEQAVLKILKSFSLDDRYKWKDSRSKEPLDPAISAEKFEKILDSAAELSSLKNISLGSAEILLERHGSRVLDPAIPYSDVDEIEAWLSIHETMCFRLKDHFMRRVPLFLVEKDHGLSKLDKVAKVFALELNLSENEVAEQTSELKNLFEHELAWRKDLD